MTANNKRSYLSYLNKLVEEYKNTYHYSIGKKPIDANYSAFTVEIESSHKAPNLNLVIDSELLSVKITLKKKI